MHRLISGSHHWQPCLGEKKKNPSHLKPNNNKSEHEVKGVNPIGLLNHLKITYMRHCKYF